MAQVFRWLRDNAQNMHNAWQDRQDSGCACHSSALSVGKYHGHENVSGVIAKSRAQSAFFHQSTAGQVHLEECQERCGLPKGKLTRDCVTRWNSTCQACASKRRNMSALIMFDAQYGDTATDA